MINSIPPQNLQELAERCQQLSGLSIAAIAQHLSIPTPQQDTLTHAKGWIGQLIERALGATSSSHAVHDFPQLAVELKTIPVNCDHKPLESTYVCTVHSNEAAKNWRDSWVYNKLKTVLWVPIVVTSTQAALHDRIVQAPILWHMDPASEQILRNDWEELMEMVQLGSATKIQAKFGTALHIRPKAANNKSLIDYIDLEGLATKIVPKGFYLRSAFTHKILLRAYASIANDQSTTVI